MGVCSIWLTIRSSGSPLPRRADSVTKLIPINQASVMIPTALRCEKYRLNGRQLAQDMQNNGNRKSNANQFMRELERVFCDEEHDQTRKRNKDA